MKNEEGIITTNATEKRILEQCYNFLPNVQQFRWNGQIFLKPQVTKIDIRNKKFEYPYIY